MIILVYLLLGTLAALCFYYSTMMISKCLRSVLRSDVRKRKVKEINTLVLQPSWKEISQKHPINNMIINCQTVSDGMLHIDRYNLLLKATSDGSDRIISSEP